MREAPYSKDPQVSLNLILLTPLNPPGNSPINKRRKVEICGV